MGDRVDGANEPVVEAVEEKTEETEDQGYDEAFDEATAEEEATPASQEEPEPGTEKKPDEKGGPEEESEKTEEEKAAEVKAAEEKEAEGVKDPDKDPDLLLQRLKDSQAKITEQGQELSGLRKGKAEEATARTEKEVLEGLSDETKGFFEDNEGAEEAMREFIPAMLEVAMVEVLAPYKKAIKELTGEIEYLQFDRQIVGGYWLEGKYHEGHPDAAAHLGKKEFNDFLETESASDPSVKDTGDPQKVIALITRFKETIAKASAEEHDSKTKEKAELTKAAAESTVDPKSGTGTKTEKGKGKEASYDETWESITQ